ncbi:DUF6993 domain-containing protein [Leucobacter sp. HY1908]
MTYRTKKSSARVTRATLQRERIGLRNAALAIAVAAVTVLPACAILEGPTPEAPKREAPAVPATDPELIAGGTAEENLPYFTEVLRDYAAGDGTIKGEPISRAVIAAGFDKSVMQISFDRSETGLEADNIFVSVLLQDSCLVGQVVTSDRSFVAEAVPAVGPENTICLIGETAPITW